MEREKRATFDSVAELYDDVRPHYPEQLFKDLLSLTQLSPDAWILEVGAGTGIATLPLAKQGYRIIAIEMGTELAYGRLGKEFFCRVVLYVVTNAP